MNAIFSRFEHPPKIVLKCEEPTLTQQHFRAECDVNNILAKFVKTGILETVPGGAYLDVSEVPDYQQALAHISEAQTLFDSLPSHIRKEFGNDPISFMDFVHDPKNVEKGIELGVFQRPAETVQHLVETEGHAAS